MAYRLLAMVSGSRCDPRPFLRSAAVNRRLQGIIGVLVGMAVLTLLPGCTAYPLFGKTAPSSISNAASESVPAARVQGDKVLLHLLQGSDQKLYVPVRVNGHATVALLDTGSFTLIDKTLLETLHVAMDNTWTRGGGFTGSTWRYTAVVEHLEIGPVQLNHYRYSALPLTDMHRIQRQQKLPLAEVILGADVLQLLNATLDFEHHALSLKLPAPAAHPTL
jgi:hypothetical protein